MLHTDSIWINLIIFVVGLGFLVKGSDLFVDGAAFIARRFNVPKVIIGLTLVSIGTSLPELATDLSAAIRGLSDPICQRMPMGDTPGSNISNILLVLGLSIVLMRTVPVNKLLFSRDTVIMAAIFMVFGIMYYNFNMSNGKPGINRIEGAVLFSIFIAYMTFLIRRRDELCEEVEEVEERAEAGINRSSTAYWFILFGCLMIPFGSLLVVDNVRWAAVKLNMDPQIITATVVAFGTSLPELSVTIMSVIKKETDIALGNVIGSNIFNLVFVMAIASMIAEVPCGGKESYFIIPYMLFAGALLMVFMRTDWSLVTWEGCVFLFFYVVYISINVYYVSPTIRQYVNPLIGVSITAPGG